MRNSETSRLCCVLLVLLLGVLSNHRVFADETDTVGAAASDGVADGSQNGSDNATATQNIGVGKFHALPFHVSISVRTGYDDNVLTSTFNRQGSAFINLNGGVTYNFGSSRTALSLQTNGGITQYLDSSTGINYDYNPNISFSLTHKATPRLTLALTSYGSYQNQPDFAENAGLTRRSGSFFYSTNKFSASYRWTPRVSTVTSYTLGTLWYTDSLQGSYENRFEHTFGNEFRFLVWPTTTLIAEYRLGLFAYQNSVRDSISHYLLAGVDHNFSPRLNISARAGAEFRSYTNLNHDRTDPYFEGTLAYKLGPRATVSWESRYSIEEPDIVNSQSRTTFRTGLSGSYNLTPRITASLNTYYVHDSNDATTIGGFFIITPAFVEDSFAASLSLRYAINHTWGAELGYDYFDVESDLPLRGYYRNRFYGGVNFTF